MDTAISNNTDAIATEATTRADAQSYFSQNDAISAETLLEQHGRWSQNTALFQYGCITAEAQPEQMQ
jgi:hypothetical protein